MYRCSTHNLWDTFRLSDSRVYQTYGTKESRKEGISSKLVDVPKVHTRWDRLKGCGMTDSDAWQWDEPDQTAEHKCSMRPACSKVDQRWGAWLQDTELINGDTRKKMLSGVV